MTNPTNSINISVWQNAEVEKGVVQGNALANFNVVAQAGGFDNTGVATSTIFQTNFKNVDIDIDIHNAKHIWPM